MAFDPAMAHIMSRMQGAQGGEMPMPDNLANPTPVAESPAGEQVPQEVIVMALQVAAQIIQRVIEELGGQQGAPLPPQP